ncbi:CMP-N-acetylneuraminate-beta-galactosamide-alpha-2,3-sialyltransferase 1 [Chelonia mydas]|uniref:CMP-N-acetylneuraminate-beta-galactosamide-alpha-2,3-sialyltransferase 1 n=1 Tax=Chelonia mydas TaxID=8469 RepID=M7C199_CHEMY|nr:CMP-N-acetylneuraminate-beta-galactosamide-alpha-2,3-sialyltransferase 1 [Chelonia mydas]
MFSEGKKWALILGSDPAVLDTGSKVKGDKIGWESLKSNATKANGVTQCIKCVQAKDLGLRREDGINCLSSTAPSSLNNLTNFLCQVRIHAEGTMCIILTITSTKIRRERINNAPVTGFESNVGSITTHWYHYPERANELPENISLIFIPYKTCDIQ